ncbi:MAG: 2,4-dihydroxyhept-2-ene-1,7-dioic acid aldolase [Proteobacteria bacterium]|nr:2,4-dihydroxyhept-2-ene-1,7-dioic acid aldolase [Pseudomonadota bacterium]MBI3499010.1 2,4-dihydroxyhept-2-ene-1,7-dioic acid aldolase [Pseudomonadota bacterium]
MRANIVKQIWKKGGCVVNGWLNMPGAFNAEVMAHAGWDSLVVDMQHGIIDYQMMVSMFQAISTTQVVPMARVSWNEPGQVMKVLDAGGYGVICPMINSREECQRFVGATRYAPKGYRSSGPIRATLYGGADYHDKANDVVVALAMIETKEALENLDQILSVKGLDGVYIGPSDLSISLGKGPGADHTDDFRLGVIMTILKACKRHGIKAGIHTASPAYAKRMRTAGFDLVTVMGDARLLTAAAKQAMAEMREGVAPGKAAPAKAPPKKTNGRRAASGSPY